MDEQKQEEYEQKQACIFDEMILSTMRLQQVLKSDLVTQEQYDLALQSIMDHMLSELKQLKRKLAEYCADNQ